MALIKFSFSKAGRGAFIFFFFFFWMMSCDHVVPEAVVAIYLVLLKGMAEES